MSKREKEDWMQKTWRPMMAVLYMGICTFDFIIAPILWSIIQAISNGGTIDAQWQPLTLQGAGLLHLSFGAILGVAAYGRTQEKLAGAANNVIATPAVMQTNMVTPQPANVFYPQAHPNSALQTPVFLSKQGKPGPVIMEPEV